MPFIEDWMRDNPKGINFKCSCGATVNLKGWVENFRFILYARCWKCNKEMDKYESIMLIEYANFNMVEYLVEEFKKEFNHDEKNKVIHLVK